MVGSKDYSVSLRGRSGIIYSEGEKEALIEAEMMAGDADLVIYFDRFHAWKKPFENHSLSQGDRERIKNNISKELEKNGLVFEWE